jgi:hypothetical protein
MLRKFWPLLLAIVGVAALSRLGRRARTRPRIPDPDQEWQSDAW